MSGDGRLAARAGRGSRGIPLAPCAARDTIGRGPLTRTTTVRGTAHGCSARQRRPATARRLTPVRVGEAAARATWEPTATARRTDRPPTPGSERNVLNRHHHRHRHHHHHHRHHHHHHHHHHHRHHRPPPPRQPGLNRGGNSRKILATPPTMVTTRRRRAATAAMPNNDSGGGDAANGADGRWSRAARRQGPTQTRPPAAKTPGELEAAGRRVAFPRGRARTLTAYGTERGGNARKILATPRTWTATQRRRTADAEATAGTLPATT